MTGRDLIIYILENNLEDKEILKDNCILPGFISVEEAALKFNVGTATIKLWSKLGVIPSIKIGEEIYVPFNVEKGVDRK